MGHVREFALASGSGQMEAGSAWLLNCVSTALLGDIDCYIRVF